MNCLSFTLVRVSYFRPRAVAPFQQIPSHNSKKKIAKKIDDSAGTLGVNIVKSNRSNHNSPSEK